MTFRDWLIVAVIVVGTVVACVPVGLLAAAVGEPWGWVVAVVGALVLAPGVVWVTGRLTR